jgi:aryl sulfotransferase
VRRAASNRFDSEAAMGWSVLTWVAIISGGLVAFLVAQFLYLSVVLAWEDQKTVGLGYYGLPLGARAAFKRTLHRHAVLLFPILRILERTSAFTFRKGSFRHRDIAGPKGTCSKESFARVDAYQPRPDDVFVATQMKCGTTWMQHVVYEVLHRGGGNLVDAGATLYSVSPWLEARKSVTIEDAPVLGTERPSRIIKTHLPASHCPFSADARYVYVARHPVSCFASCADFVRENLGAFAPGQDAIEEWFRSDDLMWWGTWVTHVRGWWELSQRSDNVLFVHFEEMKRDLAGVVGRVAEFLGVRPLDDAELSQIVHKCGFAYMQEHAHAFEMHPPHILAIDAALFVKGTTDRHADVSGDRRGRLLKWAAAGLAGSSYPLERIYPDVAAAAPSPTGP